MIIYPAIDIRGGSVVRLTKGDYGQMEMYSSNPVSVARDFRARGATHLHMVDLDGAKDGVLSNFDIITETARMSSLFTEVGGGIRDMERAEKYLSAGIGRIILGTAAVNDEAFLRQAVEEFGGGVAVGVDAKDGYVAISGWLETTKEPGYDFCVRMRDIGVKTVIYTDIARDGMLEGPNFEIYNQLADIEGLDIIASGGVSGAQDIVMLSSSGSAGVIVGKALYKGFITIEEALAAAAGK